MTKENFLPLLLLAFLNNICSKKKYDKRNAKMTTKCKKTTRRIISQNQDKSKIRSDNLKNVKDLTLGIHIGGLLINFR